MGKTEGHITHTRATPELWTRNSKDVEGAIVNQGVFKVQGDI